MLIAKTLTFYKRTDIQEAIVEHAQGKEIAVKFGERGFGKRPQVLIYPNDVMEFAKQRCSSFHGSEEIWENPLLLKTEMSKKDQDEIRTGWDLILDIDCGFFDYSKIAAHFIVKALQYCSVKSISVKFSGNKGFHIAVPWEAFPEKIQDKNVKELFPEAPKRIAEYIKFLIKDPVREEIKKREGKDLSVIAKNVGVDVDKIKITDTLGSVELNPDPFIQIDTILISSRHLYRMPYSFHEKSELVSVPVDVDKILEFDKKNAEPENVTTELKFLDRNVERGNAEGLFVRAYDYQPVTEAHEVKEQKDFQVPEEAILEDCFPTGIKNLLAGIEDGRKRGVFVLINFLRCCGWGKDQIESKLDEWNKKNHEPLREVYLKGQLKNSFTKKAVPPPNYNNEAYYKDMGIKCPEAAQFKNPVQFAKACAKHKTRKKPKK